MVWWVGLEEDMGVVGKILYGVGCGWDIFVGWGWWLKEEGLKWVGGIWELGIRDGGGGRCGYGMGGVGMGSEEGDGMEVSVWRWGYCGGEGMWL